MMSMEIAPTQKPDILNQMQNSQHTQISSRPAPASTINWKALCGVLFFLCWQTIALASLDLASLKRDQKLADFQVSHLYSDSEGKILGAKFLHVPTGAPVFLFQMETVPQLFTWVMSPTESNRGAPHALEHLLVAKGTKGRYFHLLRDMRLSSASAATFQDLVYYGLSSGSGVDGFFEQFHALLDALYRPDFTDAEAEREFYHFSVANDGPTRKTLIESGTVYNEMLSSQNRYDYAFELNKEILGEQNPFAFNSGGNPDEMREVTPQEIRRFHDKYYRIGPATGFIFSFPPQESVPGLLDKISQELRRFSESGRATNPSAIGEPKYPVHPAQKLEPTIYPFPGPNEAAPGVVHFAWTPAKSNGLLDVRMLELLSHGLAGGEDSLLYKAVVDSKTRSFDSGATGVDSELFLGNSPYSPVVVMEVSGVPGNRISLENIGQLRTLLVNKMREISLYPDQSETLNAFNRSVMSYARNRHRSTNVWIKNPPGFDSYPPDNTWQKHLDNLEADPSFVRSLSGEREWQAIEQQLGSGRNVWRELIERFHLLETPHATATAPSLRLLAETEKRRQDRLRTKISALMGRYHTSDEQEALTRFDQEELIKTKEIDSIDAKVSRPRFTDHPPMIPDQDLQYRQFEIEGVPVIANIFKRPPTIDIGVSFDLRKIPRRYYKYLPLLPNCLDSLGLKRAGQILPYSELVSKIQKDVFSFSAGFEVNPVSKRADFAMRASATNTEEFQRALDLIHQLIQFNYLDPSNAGRLRDIVARRISTDNLYAKQDVSTSNAGYSFRYQNDELYLALNSRFTGAHFDSRLKWLLHDVVSSEEIANLDIFARSVLPSAPGMSQQDLAQKVDHLNVSGLEKELVEYWRSNSSFFPETSLAEGLRQLTAEVVEDLKAGPAKTIDDLRALQRMILNRRALHLDLTLSQSALETITGDIAGFVKSIPDLPFETKAGLGDEEDAAAPIMARVKKRYRLSQDDSPWYVGFVNPSRTGGDVLFSADFPGYARLDRKSLVRVLASSLFAGTGPQSFHVGASARGLAYHNAIFNNPAVERIWYYADRSPDVPSLVSFVNEIASTTPELKDPSLVDYVFSNTFTFSRARLTFSDRGKAAAQDIRDGNGPEKISQFSEAVLKLRKDPNLLTELTHAGLAAICGVLVRDDCKEEQRAERSLFFFVGSEQVLSDVEKRASLPNLLRLYPSDFWIDFSGDANPARLATAK